MLAAAEVKGSPRPPPQASRQQHQQQRAALIGSTLAFISGLCFHGLICWVYLFISVLPLGDAVCRVLLGGVRSCINSSHTFLYKNYRSINVLLMY